MAEIKIKESGKIEENNFSDYGDFFDSQFEVIENEDGEYFSMSQEDYDWWFDYYQKRNKAQENLNELLEQKPKLQEDFNNNVFLVGVEFNDYPDAMNRFVEDNQ